MKKIDIMKIKTTLIFICCFIVTSLFADNVPVDKAQAFAIKFFNANSLTRSTSSQVDLVWTGESELTRSQDAAPAFYVFNRIDNPGFVIISGDNVMKPILGYSFDNIFTVDDMPENIVYWMNLYKYEVETRRDDLYYYTTPAHEGWDDITSFAASTRSGSKYIYTVPWNQTAPYNNLCPMDASTGRRTVTGCVATAFAIVMKYHRWPDMGEGSYYYTWNNKTIGDIFDYTYKWDEMPASPISVSAAKQIPLVMYHCGIVSEMNYSSSASGAYTRDAVNGMINHMKYDLGTIELTREWFSDEDWQTMLKAEIDANRPVIYGGSGTSGGHQFVFDGYRDEYFHVNWGWGGSSDGYFVINELSPSSLGTGGGAGGFNSGQSAVFGFQPKLENSSYNDILAFFGSSNYPDYKGLTTTTETILQNSAFTLTLGFLGNFSNRPYTGEVKIVVCNSNGSIKEELSSSFSIENRAYGSGSAYKLSNLVITQPIAAGDYVCAIHKSSDSNTWREVYGYEETTPRIYLTASTSIKNHVMNEGVSVEKQGSYLTVTSESEILEYNIYSASGMIVKSESGINQNSIMISTADLARNTYILQVKTVNGITTHKFN